MLLRLLNRHKILKRSMVIYIAGCIGALFAFVSVAQALEPIKPNPGAAGSYFTEIETCNNGRAGIDAYNSDETDSNGVRYWLVRTAAGEGATVHFYQSGTVPGCTDGSSATQAASITGVNGKKFWIAYENIDGSGPFHNPLIYDAAGFHYTYPTIVNTFNVDGHSIKLAHYTLGVDTWNGAFFDDNHFPGGGRIYLSVLTNDDLSYIDSQEKLYALIRSFSPVTTPHITTISPTSGPAGTPVGRVRLLAEDH